MIFYLEGAWGILNLPADTNLPSDKLDIPFIMYAGLRMLHATSKVNPKNVKEVLPLPGMGTLCQ